MKEKIIGVLAGLFYRIYSMSFRYRFYRVAHGSNELKVFPSLGHLNNVAYGLWHDGYLSSLGAWKGHEDKKPIVMVSASKDGVVSSRFLQMFGFDGTSVRGSSSRKGAQALLAGIKKLREGRSVIVAMDGPRGPCFKARPGVIKLSEKIEEAYYFASPLSLALPHF